MGDTKIMILNGESIELHDEEIISDETLQELSGNKGKEDE